MKRFRNEILSSKTVFLDTAPIIYFIEKHPVYGPQMQMIVDLFSSGDIAACTSVLTITEVLVKPIADGKEGLVDQFVQFFQKGKNIRTLNIDPQIAILAGKLRGKYVSLKTLDALQIATAKTTGISKFVTNDKKLKIVQEIGILVLEDFLESD